MGSYQIFKYVICDEEAVPASVAVPMAKGAEIISVGRQNGLLVAWAKVGSPMAKTVRRLIRIVGTGHVQEELGEPHLATVQVGYLVWHFFDGGEV